MTSLRPDPVFIVDYQPLWPQMFAEECEALAGALERAGATVNAIEHVGSTAVPGLASKPIIDVMIGVRDVASWVPCITPVVGLGYECLGEYGIPERIYFRKGEPRTHHIHLVVHDGEFWRRHIAFRDILRRRPDLVEQYARLKRGVAVEHGTDRVGYTEAKSPFIKAVLREEAGAGPQ
jgi:GrpB-like predicted nucleotidyltransferase (UPF0157 family)